jgi:Superfamily II DNA and RNA helicases
MQSWVPINSLRTSDVLFLKMAGGVCRNCQLLSMTLNEVGFENVALHAMIRQRERLAALTQFRSNIIRILIATDVASRGRYLLILYVFIIFSN